MKLISTLVFAFAISLVISKYNAVDRFRILKQCTVLGDESIIYARAHYVKLFHRYNPEKFSESYQQIDGFDGVTIKNTIDTYSRAIDKLSSQEKNIDDNTTQQLISACKDLSIFSKDFVENVYPKAIDYKSGSDPLSDAFFIEINQLVKFDHEIGVFDKNQNSFKHSMERYQKAVENYIQEYRASIPNDFVKSRK